MSNNWTVLYFDCISWMTTTVIISEINFEVPWTFSTQGKVPIVVQYL